MLAPYYGNGRDELHLAWNLPFLSSSFHATELFDVIEQTLRSLPPGMAPTWAISTHDEAGRAASRWCDGRDDLVRCALLILLGFPGVSIIYYGDEIGMLDLRTDLSRNHPGDDGRERARSPMQWSPGPTAGITTGVPWITIGDALRTNVSDHCDDPRSILNFSRDLIRLRRELLNGPISLLRSPENVLAWTVNNALVAVNLGSDSKDLDASGTNNDMRQP